MASITKPRVPLVQLPTNELGLTVRDYEGSMSTLCAGCGHDSITAAIVRATYELAIPPHMIAKLSGIGCSSKTPTYFVSGAHGFNSVHGRMVTIATGAKAANRDLTIIGVSGDGDSLSIGMGHMVHAIRRNVNMLYVIADNGVYGLTKGQFSASADLNSTTKRGVENKIAPIDPLVLGLSLGATFVARAFSGDKERLIPILKAGIEHPGFALIDVVSPCVQFNNHDGSTKSYRYTRDHEAPTVDYIEPREQITASIPSDRAINVTMHSGETMAFRAVPDDYDARDRLAVMAYIEEHHARGEVATGLLYVNNDRPGIHELGETAEDPLNTMPFDRLCPGSAVLEALQQGLS
ncbi:MAG: 2-oxoacid:ferredoxin oxidoreductase subunit beta [Solirubrobacteraceae bacterium]